MSRPLAEDTAVLGAGELQVWVRSKAKNVELQATVTEVRPDGKETFVQGGWLRTEARKLDRDASSLTEPHAHLPQARRQDAAEGPLREGPDPALLPGPRLPRGLARCG